MDAEAYHYEPLKDVVDSRYEIRLLKIDGGQANSALRLRLLTVNLISTTAQYDALSYVWGSEDNQQIAFVDDKSVRLRENLSSFLKHYRDTMCAEHQDAYLWIDAQCINQEDPNEKMDQVNNMSFIYSKARSVLIWLGDISQHTPSVTQFEAFLDHHCIEKRDIKSVSGSMQRPQQQHQLATNAADVLHPIELHALKIIRSPYWGRLWIVQELKLAAKASIICGSELLPLPFMTRLMTYVDLGLSNLSRHVSAKQFGLFRLATSRHEANHTWAYYVVECRDHRCSEPQDHVLGLRGLVKQRYENMTLYPGCSFGYMVMVVLECSIQQHLQCDEEHDTLAIIHQLSTVLSVGTSELLAATQKRGVRKDNSFMLAFNDVIEIFCEPSQPRIPESGGGPRRYPPHGAMWIFACESVAMHIDSRGSYLCFGPRHASVRWYSKATSGSIRNTVSEVGNLAMEPTITYLRHWRSSSDLLNAARSWMKAKSAKEFGHGPEGTHEVQDLKHFYVPCSFLELTELYAAFRILAGLPD
ncbi:hypothetical protein LTR97_011363 [Elasticomyces elasticus]|uniref:Heterokaryon incompatibility domain-containing protein n=1 Tax=Elasticomyces elasticus TaxID=574655 RepID=A0AAN7VYF8_9PEZI|nr:hypothetical protein LTR97_011363 [Elasticomyces elasticus]